MKSTSATQLAILLCFCETASGILFVQRNEARGFDSLDGLWTFVREPFNSHGLGFQHKWHTLDISTFENATVMPVPSAFNDIDAHASLRDHVGWVWYQTEYRVNKRDFGSRTFLRFGSVQYYAVVFVNGRLVTSHVGGHLPFEAEVSLLHPGQPNRITVAVNNTLSATTVPH
ncbi:glycosyl hydrolase family 2, partial [Aphelenchoides avenae]